MKTLLKVLTLLCLFYSTQSQSCQDFSEGLCPMDESNIVSSDMNIWSPDECQALCMYVTNWKVFAQFNHVNSEMRIFAIFSPMLEANASWLMFVIPSMYVLDVSVVLPDPASVSVKYPLHLLPQPLPQQQPQLFLQQPQQQP